MAGEGLKFTKRGRSRSDSREDRRHGRDYDRREPSQDPYTSGPCLSFREFQSMNQRGGKSDEEVFKLYCDYKSDYEYRVFRSYFDEHKDEEWMLEKYHPIKSIDSVSMLHSLKQSCFTQFVEHLSSGALDSVSYSAPCVIASTPLPSDSLTKEIELLNNLAEVTPLVTSSTLSHINPSLPHVLIKRLSKTISRVALEQKIKDEELTGFIGVILLPPSPQHRDERRGFVLFATDDNATDAIDRLNAMSEMPEMESKDRRERRERREKERSEEKESEDDVKTHKIAFVARKVEESEERQVMSEYEAPEQVKADIKLSTDLIATLDQEASLDSALLLSDRVALIISSQDTEMQLDAQHEEEDKPVDHARNLKTLDMNIFYLRFVHGYTYYTNHESMLPVSTLTCIRRTVSLLLSTNHIFRSGPSSDPSQKLIARNTQKLIVRTTLPNSTDLITLIGGKCAVLAIESFIGQIVKRVGEGKFMCRECEKVFKGEVFCRKHVEGKHGDIVEGVEVEVGYFNRYVRDWERVGVWRENSNKRVREQRPERHGRDNRDQRDQREQRDNRDQRDQREVRRYVDLDTVVQVDRPVIQYDY